MATLTPTKQQSDVLQALRGYFQAKASGLVTAVFSIFLSAVAGAGKTSTIMMIADVVAEVEREYGMLEWTVLSFNKAIMLASNKKLEECGARQVAKTTNGLGRGILAVASESGQCHKPGKLNNFKYDDIIKNYCKKNARKLPTVAYGSAYYLNEKSLTSAIKKLVSAARLTYCQCDSEEALAEIVEHYDTGIDLLSPYWPFIWQAVCPVIASGVELYQASGEHDFDDQLFLPLRLDVAAPIYDLICTDEAQDLNKVRTELIKRSVKPNGLLFSVGDRRQAIQGFAFADTDSVDNIIRDTKAVEMPLTCCWRCDSNIIKLAQAINPLIEGRPNAPAGNVEVVSPDKYIDLLQSGYWSPDASKCIDADMVVCRVTAELVKDCLKAIRAGKHATVRGRDIGRGIISLLDKVLSSQPQAYEISKLSDAARRYFSERAIALMNKKNSEEEIEKLSDQVDTLDALIDGYAMETTEGTIDGLKTFIDSKFQDESNEDSQQEGRRPIVFSTVHKAKGLETDTVYILRGDLMPHPMAMKSGKDWQIEQEYNVLYVAITRPKHTLRFVGSVPACLVAEFNNIVDGDVELDAVEIIETAGMIVNGQQPELLPVIETVDASVSDVQPASASEIVETVNTGKRPYGGRKALDNADKRVLFQQTWDVDIRHALTAMTEAHNASNENRLSEADMLEKLVMESPTFATFFYGSQYERGYNERQARAMERRIAYKHRNRKKGE